MGFAQLIGRYRRLKQELAVAYSDRPWHSGRIDRLTYEIAATEQELAAMAPLDELGSGPTYSLKRMIEDVRDEPSETGLRG